MEPIDPRLLAAFDSLESGAAVVDTAKGHLARFWHTAPEPERQAVLGLLHRSGAAHVFDAFRTELAFGTGGCRGRVGLGPNRMNPQTLERLVRAHAGFLSSDPDAARRGVVIGWDTRQFFDVDGCFDADKPPSVLGWSSAEAAQLAAQTYSACGVAVHWPGTGGTVGALSFAVRHLHAAGGLYISASHNPPDHNGAKFYAATGGQVVPPVDEELAASAPAQTADEPAPIRPLAEEVRDAWLADVHTAAGARQLAGLPVVYTALHGAGAQWVVKALRAAGATVHIVREQHAPNGTFATIPGASPNPENREALTRAIALADEVNADVVLATDPDADRIGVACRDAGGWRVLTGNQIALVCTEQVARTAPEGAWVLQTAVTTSAVERLARLRGLQVRADAPVGFKYLGVQMDALPGPFALAVEESHGVLISDGMRDKDAVGAALLVAAAARAERLGATLDRLQDELGPTPTRLVSRAIDGPGGRSELDAAMASLRAQPPQELAGVVVERMEDGLSGEAPACASEAAARNVLRFFLPDGVLTLRPSGTEAKVKVYAERWGAPGDNAIALETSLGPLIEALLQRLSDGAARTGRGTAG